MRYVGFGKCPWIAGHTFFDDVFGWIAGRKGIISRESRKGLSDILIYIVSPCNIMESFRQNITGELMRQSVVVLVIAACLQFFYLGLNCFLYRRYAPKQQAVLKYATICSNGNFIGIPVINGIFGSKGVLFAALTLLPVRINIWTAGIALFSQAQDKKETMRKILLHPCILSIFAGFLMMLANTYPPEPVWNVISSVSKCMTPLAMLLVGSIIADADWRKMIDKTTLYYSTLRLLAIPLVVLVFLRLCRVDSFLTGVSVVLAGMPAASLTAVFAEKYDSDVELASKCIVVSTLLSVATVPLLCIALGK